MMKTHLLIVLCLMPFLGLTQDIQLGSGGSGATELLGEPFSVYGNFGVNFRAYDAFNTIPNRQIPYTTSITASATIKSYGLTIPISFVLQNLDDTDQPFNKEYWDGFFTNQRNRLTRFGASPSYKWVTAHLGYRYMNFSQFTLANHNFLGAGIELFPDKYKGNKWRIMAMGGRLAKAEPQSMSLNTITVQQYDRRGWGFKVGYIDSPRDLIEVSLFYARDDTGSLQTQYNGDSTFVVTPKENLAISLNAKKSLGKHFSFQFEVAKSALTRNTDDSDYDKGFALYNSFIFQRKSSTAFNNAADVKLEYRKRSQSDFMASLSYRRIDPGYGSLGAYFFNNDLEDITANARFSFKLGQKKRPLMVQLTGGFRHNNLNKDKLSSYNRFIGSAFLNYNLEDWNFSANLTNFSSKVDYQLSTDLDSLNPVIISQEASIIINRVIPGNGTSFQSINFIMGIQTVNDNVESPDQSVASDLFFVNAAYSINTRTAWQFSVRADYNSNESFVNKLNRYGAGGQIGKSFKKSEYYLGLGVNYYLQVFSKDNKVQLWSNFVRGSWKMTKRQTLNLQINLLRSNALKDVNTSMKSTELMGSIGYNLSFGYSAAKRTQTNQFIN